MNAPSTASRKRAPLLIAGSVLLVALVGMILLVRMFLGKKVEKIERAVPQLVQIVRPPEDAPPPPPPPEEKIEDPLPKDTPDPSPTPDQAPQNLGLDADGSAGSDAFGLAARHGGADLLGTGTAIFGRYTSLLRDAVQDRLSADDEVRKGSYSAVIRIWLSADGHVERAMLAQSTGKPELDAAIQRSLGQLTKVAEAPPLEMPQPITLKIVSRG
jgi:protein TonB